MPLLPFAPRSGNCKLCGGLVEIAVSEPERPPQECPKCGQPVQRLPSLGAPAPKILRKPSPSEAKEAGFHVLKKIGRGEYERQ